MPKTPAGKHRCRVLLELPAPLLAMLDALAHREKTSRADLIRYLIRTGILEYARRSSDFNTATIPIRPTPSRTT